MAYRNYKLSLIFRVTIIFILLASCAYSINNLDFKNAFPLSIIILTVLIFINILAFHSFIKFTVRRFYEMDDFFESIKYNDFTRWFVEKSGPKDIRQLHQKFNEVNQTIRIINKSKETQHLYLQKIIELIDTGIVAYNLKSGKVLWINSAFKKILDIPSLKNIDFIQKRKLQLFNTLFETHHKNESTISVEIQNNKIKLLISTSIFRVEEDVFKLIVLQNIDSTIDRTESEAWKKLLSVMTHEIMNSIAPISSLADTLQSKIKLSTNDAKNHPLEISDLNIGIESIKNRSEGLLKFAKTYRSLNKVTKLNLSDIFVYDLFENIKTLMIPSFETKDIQLIFEIDGSDIKIEIDSYLIEQVLINLIINSVEACKENQNTQIKLSATKNTEGKTIIKIRDNGKGVPKEIIDDIFIPFFSTKKNGSGIGLSLCKQIMLLHKGKVQIKSIENEGTLISLIF